MKHTEREAAVRVVSGVLIRACMLLSPGYLFTPRGQTANADHNPRDWILSLSCPKGHWSWADRVYSGQFCGGADVQYVGPWSSCSQCCAGSSVPWSAFSQCKEPPLSLEHHRTTLCTRGRHHHPTWNEPAGATLICLH